ncbi:MAG: DUF4126 domain-containing protein [Pirellulales bacterium]
MKIQSFLEHHGIASNPFTEEDAQTDPVFKDHCIGNTYHPVWDKVYGDPGDPSTSLVFGEKGAGKTALRLQIVRHIDEHNRQHPAERIFVIEYDDFNPFLDRFRGTFSPRQQRADKVLAQWKLWDHMDAILSLGVTQLVDRLIGKGEKSEAEANPRTRLDRLQSRDLMLLTACYDQSPSESFKKRWKRLASKVKYRTWASKWRVALGTAVTVGVFVLVALLQKWDWLESPWIYLAAAAGWIPWGVHAWHWHWRARRMAKQLKVVQRETSPLRQVLGSFRSGDIASQPLPDKDRTDDRYELLTKFQQLLKSLDYAGIVVLVDRVDEPDLINGSSELMRTLIWPILDNKFLKHQGIGFKLLLPIELSYYIQREDRDFHQRARLDKQNMIPSLDWTGEALYDVANARLKACAQPGKQPSLSELFDANVGDRRLIDALRSLRVPRHMFKFMYRLLVAHLNAHTDEDPAWQISSSTFESVLAVYMRDQDAVERGVGAG